MSAEIPGMTEAARRVGDITFNGMVYVERCVVQNYFPLPSEEHPASYASQNVELVLRKRLPQGWARVTLLFEGVQDFEADLDASGQVSGFKVYSLAERQLEGLQWQVGNYENDPAGVTFCARSARVVAAELMTIAPAK